MKAILYAAKSTQDVRGSIPTQLDDGRKMSQAHGWEVAGEYADEASSAWSGDRGPRLAAALAHAEQIAPCVLVVQHSDRLARGDGRAARHLGEIYFWALKADVQIRSVQDDSTFTNPLLAFAMGERNAEDSRRKSLSVQAGMDRRARQGLWNGGRRPYGYTQGADGALQVLPAEAVIVKRIYAEFIAGRAITAIARGLHSDGVGTVRGVRWRQSTVSGILRNPVYLGQMRHHDERLAGAHPPIIDEPTWNAAGALLSARPQRGRGRPPQGLHLFRGGLLRCECGEAMVPRTNGGYQMYYCNGRNLYGCTTAHIRRVEIDDAVYRYFEQVGLDIEATRDALTAGHARRLAEITALEADADHDAQRATVRLARVRSDYVDGRIDAADWSMFRDELTEQLAGATAARERLAASREQVTRDDAQLDAEHEVLERLTEIRRTIAGEIGSAEGVDAIRATLTRLFDRFILHSGRPGRAHVELLGTMWIEPIVRPEVIAGYSASDLPILRREPIPPTLENNGRACPDVEFFSAIPVAKARP